MADDAISLRFTALPGIPAVSAGDDLAELILEAAGRAGVELNGGVLLVAQKIISKAEGRSVRLADVTPSEEARKIAAEDEKDPRHVQVVLDETARIVRRGHRVMICETHHGFVCANAGVDLSNAPGEDVAVLLPQDSNASASRLRDSLMARGCRDLGVIVTDTFGRPWREGLVDMAIGSAGVLPLVDQRGGADLVGRELQVTTTALVDQLAAGAGILMLKDAAVPAVFASGALPLDAACKEDVSSLLRDPGEDLFR